MTKEIITQDYVKQLFEYRDGALYWKHSPAHNVRAGSKAGNIQSEGYRSIKINNKTYKAHRLIFLMFHGWLPEKVDHKDANTSNNQIENLRPATSSENSFNAKKRVDNKSGVKNVYWNKQCNKWAVQVSINNKHKYFGLYDDLELADLVAQEARDKYHGAFANHG